MDAFSHYQKKNIDNRDPNCESPSKKKDEIKLKRNIKRNYNLYSLEFDCERIKWRDSMPMMKTKEKNVRQTNNI